MRGAESSGPVTRRLDADEVFEVDLLLGRFDDLRGNLERRRSAAVDVTGERARRDADSASEVVARDVVSLEPVLESHGSENIAVRQPSQQKLPEGTFTAGGAPASVSEVDPYDAINRERERRRQTWADVARLSGVDPATISKWHQGSRASRRAPSLASVIAIADGWGMSIDQLLGHLVAFREQPDAAVLSAQEQRLIESVRGNANRARLRVFLALLDLMERADK